jgi:hypothetical protein
MLVKRINAKSSMIDHGRTDIHALRDEMLLTLL